MRFAFAFATPALLDPRRLRRHAVSAAGLAAGRVAGYISPCQGLLGKPGLLATGGLSGVAGHGGTRRNAKATG
jgi:hypothetical protein